MNNELEAFARTTLKSGLAKCTDRERKLFRQMYGHTLPNGNVDKVVDLMPSEKLDWAMEQVKRTLEKHNAKTE